MASKTYQNFNLIVGGERVQDVHISTTNPNINLERLFEIIIASQPEVKVEAWKAKSTPTGINALLVGDDDSSEEVAL